MLQLLQMDDEVEEVFHDARDWEEEVRVLEVPPSSLTVQLICSGLSWPASSAQRTSIPDPIIPKLSSRIQLLPTDFSTTES